MEGYAGNEHSRSVGADFHRSGTGSSYDAEMSEPFDNAIRSLKAIAFEASPRISITLDLTGLESPAAAALSSLAERDPGPELTIIHHPDNPEANESKFVHDLLSMLADRTSA